jgi:hypothetical protein
MSVVMSVGNGNCRSTEALQSVLSRAVDVSLQEVTFSGLRDRCRGGRRKGYKETEQERAIEAISTATQRHSDTATQRQ